MLRCSTSAMFRRFTPAATNGIAAATNVTERALVPAVEREFIPPAPMRERVRKAEMMAAARLLRYGQFGPHQVNILPIDDETTVQQDGHLSPWTSDHFRVSFSVPAFTNTNVFANFQEQLLFRSENWMMQARKETAKKPANTAFPSHEETEAQYKARYIKHLNRLKLFLINNPNVAAVFIQEAPIGDHADFMVSYINDTFPKNWRVNNPSVTSDTNAAKVWGVFTLINNNVLETSKSYSDETLTQRIPNIDLRVRCRTFVMYTSDGTPIKITHNHLPHSNPEAAFRALLTVVLEEVMEHGLNRETFNHSLLGDWNIEADRMNELLQEITADLISKVPSGTVLPFALTAKLATSRDGHVKQNCSTMSVDSLLTISVKPSRNYNFRFNKIEPQFVNEILEYVATIASVLFVGVAGFKDQQTSERVYTEEERNQMLDEALEETFRPF